MDEPCSALDPIATSRIEDLMWELKENFTIIIVTHSMQQASRVSQRTGFFHMGVEAKCKRCGKVTAGDQEKSRPLIMSRFEEV